MIDGSFSLFNSEDFMPHGHCFLWLPQILWLHVISDAGIAFAYYAIPVLLFYLIRKRKDLPYKGVFGAFCLFILLCGTTHLMSIWVLWHPDYGLEGVIKALTAVVSISALFILWRIVPQALKFINPALSKQLASENRLRALVDNADDAIITKTLDGVITSWNPGAERLFGYTAAEAIGQPITFIVPPGHLAEEQQILSQLRRGEHIEHFETTRMAKDGHLVDISLTVSPIRDSDGNIVGASKVARDISERKRTEEALRKSEEQLSQAQKMEAIGNLTGGMAHDFNNLLGVMVGNLDLLLDRLKSNHEAEQLAQAALNAALRGADLTRRLLAFARQQPLQPQRIDLNNLVDGITKLLRRTLGEDIQISLHFSPDVWPVVADPVQLEAALTNLATNARDAMPHGGQLVISTCNRRLDTDYTAAHPEVVPGDYAVIEVSDTGSGIPQDILGRVFEPFFTTKARDKGTGLGLSMIFGFMKQSGGHVSVYSEVNKGTTFRLYLPRMTSKGSTSEVSVTTPKNITRGHETILVVEDNSDVRRVVSRQLDELGYHVLEAEDATAALALLTEGAQIDLLFTDIVMPGKLNGLELARLAVERWPALKVVLTSGFPEARINGHADPIAGTRLLSKPYRKQELARTLREILEGDESKN